MPCTDDAGRLLNYEAAAKVEAFRGSLDNARRLFREGKTGCRPSSRYLREWGAFEKRSGSLDVSHRRTNVYVAIFSQIAKTVHFSWHRPKGVSSRVDAFILYDATPAPSRFHTTALVTVCIREEMLCSSDRLPYGAIL